jgi:hypothetical protein
VDSKGQPISVFAPCWSPGVHMTIQTQNYRITITVKPDGTIEITIEPL